MQRATVSTKETPASSNAMSWSPLLNRSARMLQRKCACGGTPGPSGECEDCRKKRLQRKTRNSELGTRNDSVVPPIVYEVLRSPGQPLDAETRAFMEPRFGHDFSQVRVHGGAQAEAVAESVNANAFTVGSRVVFGAGQPNFSSRQGKELLAHELAHVVQQESLSSGEAGDLRIGSPDEPAEREAEVAAAGIMDRRHAGKLTPLDSAAVQRDLALPPKDAPAALVRLTAAQVAAAIAYNKAQFADPYSIRVLRDVMGLEPIPAIVDKRFVEAVVEWQAARGLVQDGKVGHFTTRTFYLELVTEGELRDAILLVMDSYRLPEDLRLNNVSVGTGQNCCHNGADAVTSGGPHCGGGPINVCFCTPQIPTTAAGYDHFVRISGHELIHVPQCAAGTGNVDVDEFEAFFYEACHEGRAPRLAAADRVNHAQIALGHFANISVALRTAGRTRMRNQLNALIAARGAGRC